MLIHLMSFYHGDVIRLISWVLTYFHG